MKQKPIISTMILAGLLQTAGQALATEPSGTANLSGQYTGLHRLTMNTIDPAAMAALTLPKTKLDGVEYIVLGQSIGSPLWYWDFDAGTVTWGGDTLFAMKMVITTYQPYNQVTVPEKTAEQQVNIASLAEVTMPLTDNGDGTYTVDYAQKIHLPMAGYPIGVTSTTFRIQQREDGTLSIRTIDHETDGAGNDGVPGTRIAGVFPYVVQPQFDAEVMYPEPGTDGNHDGLSDLEATLLGLAPDQLDSDGDGTSDADELGLLVRPTDSDGDGVPDILENGNAGNDDTTLSGLRLTEDLVLTASSTDGVGFQASGISGYQHQLAAGQSLDGDPIPTTDADGNALTFFQLAFTADAFAILDLGLDGLAYDLAFNQRPPSDLLIWEKTMTMTLDPDSDTSTEIISYRPLTVTTDANDPNRLSIELEHSMASSTRKQIVLGMVIPEGDDNDPNSDGGDTGGDGSGNDGTDNQEPGGNGSSGGSIGWWGFLAVAALTGLVRRRRRN